MLVGKKGLNWLIFVILLCFPSWWCFVGLFFGGQSEDAADATCSDLTSTQLGNRNYFSDLEGGWVESVKTTGK